MKICDLTIFYSETSGGVRTYLTEKQKYVRTHRPDVKHVIIVPGPENSVHDDGNTRLYRFKAPRQLVNANYHMPLRPGPFLEALEQEKPDLIEAGSPFISPWAAFEYRRRHGIPVAGFFHANIAETYVTAIPPAFQFLFRGLFYHAGWWWCRRVFNRCDMVLAPTRRIKDLLETRGIGRVYEQGFGVDPDVFTPENRDLELRRSIGADPDTIVFLFVGRLHREKGLDVAVKSFLQIEQEKSLLLIAGAGQARSWVESVAAKNPRVRYLGFLKNRAELARTYASSDIFVMPCANETFGMAYLEALASGIPIVGIKGSGIIDQIPGRYCLSSNAGDIIGFAANMVAMRNNLRSMQKRELHDFVLQQGYDWNSTFEQLFTRYEKLLEAPALR